jgi:hypothetical protein
MNDIHDPAYKLTTLSLNKNKLKFKCFDFTIDYLPNQLKPLDMNVHYILMDENKKFENDIQGVIFWSNLCNFSFDLMYDFQTNIKIIINDISVDSNRFNKKNPLWRRTFADIKFDVNNNEKKNVWFKEVYLDNNINDILYSFPYKDKNMMIDCGYVSKIF